MITKKLSLILLISMFFSINLFAAFDDDVDILLENLIKDSEKIKEILEDKIKFCNDVKHEGAYSDDAIQLTFLAKILERETNKRRNLKGDTTTILKSMLPLGFIHQAVLLQYQQVNTRITGKQLMLMTQRKNDTIEKL